MMGLNYNSIDKVDFHKLTSEESGDGKVDGDRFLRDFVRASVEDVFAHVMVCWLTVEGLVGAALKCTVALLKG